MTNNVENKAIKEQVVLHIRQVLSDSYSVYFKTHSYHWNVEGMNFHSLHGLFEEQYTEMWQAIDDIAERLRSLGAYAPINYQEITAGSKVKLDETIPNAQGMVAELAVAHEVLLASLKDALTVIEEAGDDVSADVVLGRMAVHEKYLWMLKSLAK